MPSIRQARVGEMIKRVLAEIFLREMRDPRLALVSVTDVDVARDFTVAKVFVSVIGDDEEKAEALKTLQRASGFLRGQLGNRIELRTVPQLMFRYDTGVERGARMFELLRENAALNNSDGDGADKAQAANEIDALTEEDFARDADEDGTADDIAAANAAAAVAADSNAGGAGRDGSGDNSHR
jgi:ribosome-binding factor A